MGQRNHAFWQEHGGLVCSNSKADDSVMIANALLKPSFHRLLSIASEFGLEQLISQWEDLCVKIEIDGDEEDRVRLKRATPIVLRSLQHMKEAADS